jgi:hypothetical protein
MCPVHNVQSVLVLPVLEEVMATYLLKRKLFFHQKRPGTGKSDSLACSGISLQTFAPGDGNVRRHQRGHTVAGVSPPPVLSGGTVMHERTVTVQNTHVATICRHSIAGMTCTTERQRVFPRPLSSVAGCVTFRRPIILQAAPQSHRADSLGPLALHWYGDVRMESCHELAQLACIFSEIHSDSVTRSGFISLKGHRLFAQFVHTTFSMTASSHTRYH